MKPSVLDENNFSGGFIISSVALYDLTSKKRLAHANIHVKNSKSVKHFSGLSSRKQIVNQELHKNLLKQKTNKIIRYFNIK